MGHGATPGRPAPRVPRPAEPLWRAVGGPAAGRQRLTRLHQQRWCGAAEVAHACSSRCWGVPAALPASAGTTAPPRPGPALRAARQATWLRGAARSSGGRSAPPSARRIRSCWPRRPAGRKRGTKTPGRVRRAGRRRQGGSGRSAAGSQAAGGCEDGWGSQHSTATATQLPLPPAQKPCRARAQPRGNLPGGGLRPRGAAAPGVGGRKPAGGGGRALSARSGACAAAAHSRRPRLPLVSEEPAARSACDLPARVQCAATLPACTCRWNACLHAL